MKAKLAENKFGKNKEYPCVTWILIFYASHDGRCPWSASNGPGHASHQYKANASYTQLFLTCTQHIF